MEGRWEKLMGLIPIELEQNTQITPASRVPHFVETIGIRVKYGL